MNYVERAIDPIVRKTLKRGKSLFLFGARQTGKSTLVERLKPALSVSFARNDLRQRYERTPDILRGEVEALSERSGGRLPLVVVDEVQKVPAVTDTVQDLIDRRKALFLLTGSSARKLRRHAQTNLLPGRAAVLQLDPFSLGEWPGGTLEERLLDGALPGMVASRSAEDRELDLAAYVTAYLEEEIRAEAAVRRLDHFSRFLELASSESGQIVNLSKLAGEIGVAHTTISGYYQILEDCLIAERVEPLTTSATRKKLTKSSRYLFFDLGVRRVAAREGRRPPLNRWGTLFEQFIGLEILRYIKSHGRRDRLRFWRDPNGPEVDWVIESDGVYTPIEVKWTEVPTVSDARHLHGFMAEYPTSGRGFVVCRTPVPVKLSERVMAFPWQRFLDELPWDG